MIIQAGIREVIYISDKYADDDKFAAARKLFEMAGVKLRQMPLPDKKIKIDFEKYL
jgi:dCMP deaminase